MTATNGSRWWLPGAAGVLVGFAIGYHAAPEPARPNPQERGLDAITWMQTSGEYRACCLQTYRFALERLIEKHRVLPKDGRTPAIIMDLDETVLDNSGYETWLFQHGTVYSDDSWKRWEKDHGDDVALVPGALDLIRGAEQMGVRVVFISNRFEENRDATTRTLHRLGIDTQDIDERLLLTTGSSDKTARRKQIFDRCRVLMLFGDNLRDFSEEFKAAKVDPGDTAGQNRVMAARLKQVDDHRSQWGSDWIVLPNPVYGEWTKLIGKRPGENMRQTKMNGR
jgi:5'-nucleotidase (lipoprotein e(P4) family)